MSAPAQLVVSFGGTGFFVELWIEQHRFHAGPFRKSETANALRDRVHILFSEWGLPVEGKVPLRPAPASEPAAETSPAPASPAEVAEFSATIRELAQDMAMPAAPPDEQQGGDVCREEEDFSPDPHDPEAA